jgi:Xaa-Pro aminopeptidase
MKIKEFQKEMAGKKIDLVLFFNMDGDNIDPNMTYFSQYTGFGALAITPKNAFLVVPKAEYQRAKSSSRVRVVVVKEKILDTLKRQLLRRPKVIGIDKNRVSVSLYSKIKKETHARFVDISRMCLRLRASKTQEEIGILRKACAITDEIMQKTLWRFKDFKTESEAAAFMINETNKLGLAVSFKPIVASGKNAAEPHHEPNNKPLNRGFCVIDFGVKYKGYCADMTRTVYIGQPGEKEIELYHTVLNVQNQLIQMCTIGKSFIKINEKAHELFCEKSKYFTHLIGHGVGTEIHENPNPKKTPKRPVTKLLENSVITIEPGLYYPNKLGIRIEDDVLITAKGPEVITKTGKNLLIIKK